MVMRQHSPYSEGEDGAVLLHGAGVQGDLTVNVCTVCKGVNVCCGGGAEGLELPALCRGAVLCCPNCGSEAKIQLAPNSEFEEPKNPYGQPYRPYGMPMNNRMNGYAVAGFVLSCVALVLMCVFPPLSILGIVFSTLGLSQIKKSFQRGKGLAVAGLTIGMITTVFSVFLYAMVFIESLW